MKNELTDKQRKIMELELISAIADRAVTTFSRVGREYDKFSAFMDIEIANEVFGLRLTDLAMANDADFGHDVFGIYQHIDRSTKSFPEGWLPRHIKAKSVKCPYCGYKTDQEDEMADSEEECEEKHFS